MIKWLQDEHNRSFINWLRDHVTSQVANSNHQVPSKLKWLSQGPRKEVLQYSSYLIDGVTFHTKELDESRAVQNSGVTLCANVMQVASAKDKKPVMADMVFYGTIEEIWELDYQIFRVVVFKCSWIDNNGGLKVDQGFTLVDQKKKGSHENMGENDSDDSAVASKDTQSTRSTRGKICLNGLVQRRVKRIIQEVEFNKHGHPIGKVASEMQSYIGHITREHVKVNHKTWREIPKDVKDMIWETVNLSYKVPQSWRSGFLESACTKWCTWKSRLYHDYIVPNKDNPTKLHAPPPDSGILAVDWGQFVIS
ncbi:hypothetical protein C2S51_008708 [Perilla frutescens var. frutescens]|nr:hypothetical protein C2S51_008708 [Perilla frutescens var. frutescens]